MPGTLWEGEMVPPNRSMRDPAVLVGQGLIMPWVCPLATGAYAVRGLHAEFLERICAVGGGMRLRDESVCWRW